MKLRPIPIETTNPFAEAALGDQMPGQAGVGAAAPVDTAWDKAVQAVAGEGAQGESEHDSNGERSLDEGVAAVEAPEGAAMLGESPTDQNMGPTWDRLSMTVASMVAWNLDAEVAPDREADLIDGQDVIDPLLVAESLADATAMETTEVAATQTPLVAAMASGLASTLQTNGPSDKKTMVDSATETVTSAVSTNADSLFQTDETAPTSTGQSNVDANSEVTVQIETNLENTTTLREGNVADSLGLEVQAAPTEVRSAQPIMADVGSQLGTDAANGLPIVSKTPTSTVIPEIPTSPLNGDAVDSNGAADAALRATSDSPDPLQLIKNISVRSDANAGQSANVDLDRLQGLRAALAELDTDTLHRMQSARLEQNSRIRIKVAPRASNNDLTHMVEQVQVRQARIPDAYVQKQLADAFATSEPEKAFGQKPGQAQPGHVAAEAETFQDLETLPGKSTKGSTSTKPTSGSPMSGGLRLGSPMAKGQDGTTDAVIEGSSATATHSGIVGEETAQIEIDAMRNSESAELDAETIEAMEIPELPINDPSQIDIDIEDPAGHVRLDLSRQANEVAIHLETPSEVLEEYRNMEDDIDAALAEHGLNLDTFDAQAGSDGSAEGNEDEQNSKGDNTDSLEPGTKPLEDTGERGRLLNMIV